MSPLAVVEDANALLKRSPAAGRPPADRNPRLLLKKPAARVAPSQPSDTICRATQPDLRVLRQLAGRLEASVQGSLNQDLVRQLIETLADLSQTLRSQVDTSCGFVESGAISAGNSSAGVTDASEPARWTNLLAWLKASGARSSPSIAVVDRDPDFRSAICRALEAVGLRVEAFADCDQFLGAPTSFSLACLIIDSNLPGMSGLKLLRTLCNRGQAMPVIVVAGQNEAQTAVAALKAGVIDFLEKPVYREVLLASIERALVRGRESEQLSAAHDAAVDRLLKLTPRQRQVMNLILAGHPSKNIAADIGLSQRTVESHRAEVMRKTGVRSMPALARVVATAAIGIKMPLSFDFGPNDRQLTPIGDGAP